jgi:predicted dehydrogenase
MEKGESMNKRIRIAVVGGNFGETHILGFRHCPETEVVAICRRQKDLAEQIAQRHQIPKFYTNFNEMVQSEDIDVVSLAVPNYLHHPMTLEALDQDKHVICEKPLALNLEEATEMLNKAEQKSLIHMTVFNWRFVPAIMRMKELIENGDIGSIYHVSFYWWINSRRDRESPFFWRFNRTESGVGALGDTGVHGIDLIQWMAGDFKEVSSHMAIYVPEHKTQEGQYKKTDVEDSCSFLGELIEGGQVIFHVSSVACCDSMIRLEIHGSEGALGFYISPRTGDYNGKLYGGKGETDLRREIPLPERIKSNFQPIHEKISSPAMFFARFAQNLVKAIRRGESSSPSFHDGLKVQRVLQALYHSWEKRKWVGVNDVSV